MKTLFLTKTQFNNRLELDLTIIRESKSCYVCQTNAGIFKVKLTN